MTKVLNLLIKARSYLKGPENHLRGLRYDSKGGYCAQGMLDAAWFGVTNHRPNDLLTRPGGPKAEVYQGAVNALYEGIPEAEREPWKNCEKFRNEPLGTLVQYNNTKGYEAIASLFDRTIAVRKLTIQATKPELEKEAA